MRIEVHDRKSEGEAGGPVRRGGGDNVEPRAWGWGRAGRQKANDTRTTEQNGFATRGT